MNEKTESNEVILLKKKRESYRTRVFIMMIEIALIFGIPAFFGFFIGGKLDEIYETGRKLSLGVLAITFTTSWIVVIIRYKKLARSLTEVNKAIKEKEGENKNL